MEVPNVKEYWELPFGVREQLFLKEGIGYSIVRLIQEDKRLKDILLSMEIEDRKNIRWGIFK